MKSKKARKPKRETPELKFQEAVVEYCDLVLPRDAVLMMIPAARDIETGAVWKRMGYRRGSPDLLLLWRGKAHGIELKAPGRTMSPEQKDMARCFSMAGSIYTTCHSLEAVECFLQSIGIPLRAQVTGKAAA